MSLDVSVRDTLGCARGVPDEEKKGVCPIAQYVAREMVGRISAAVMDNDISRDNAKKTLEVIEGFWEEGRAEDALFFLEGLLVCINAEEMLPMIKILDGGGETGAELYREMVGELLAEEEIRELTANEYVCTISDADSEYKACAKEVGCGTM